MAVQPATSKRKAKKAVASKTVIMLGSSVHTQDLPDASGQSTDLMDILMAISSWLEVNKHFIQEAGKNKAAAATRRQASPSWGMTETWGQRGPTAQLPQLVCKT